MVFVEYERRKQAQDVRIGARAGENVPLQELTLYILGRPIGSQAEQ